MFGRSRSDMVTQAIFKNLAHTDVLFNFKNGDTLKAHLCFVQLVPKLDELCQMHGRHGECQVYIDAYTSAAFALLLEWVYTRKSWLEGITEENCFECLILAEDFQVDGLMYAVERFVAANHAVHFKNYVEVIENEYYKKSLTVADELYLFCVEYVDSLDLSVIPKELFQDILKKVRSIHLPHGIAFGRNNNGHVSGFGPGPGSSGFGSSQSSSGFGSPQSSGGFGTAPSQPSGGFGTGPSQTSGGFGTGPSQPSSGGFGTGPSQTSGGFGTGPSQPSGGFGSSQSSGGFGTVPSQPSGGFTEPSGFGSNPTQTSTEPTGFGSNSTQTSSGFGSPSPTPAQPGSTKNVFQNN